MKMSRCRCCGKDVEQQAYIYHPDWGYIGAIFKRGHAHFEALSPSKQSLGHFETQYDAKFALVARELGQRDGPTPAST